MDDDGPQCLFTATLVGDDPPQFEIPTAEVEAGTLDPGATYRIGVFDGPSGERTPPDPAPAIPKPPVEVGEIRFVEIDDEGDRGDGIAHADRGFVIFVEGANQGDRVKIRIEEVADEYATASVIEGPA